MQPSESFERMMESIWFFSRFFSVDMIGPDLSSDRIPHGIIYKIIKKWFESNPNLGKSGIWFKSPSPESWFGLSPSKGRRCVLVQGGFELLPISSIYEIVVFQMPAWHQIMHKSNLKGNLGVHCILFYTDNSVKMLIIKHLGLAWNLLRTAAHAEAWQWI